MTQPSPRKPPPRPPSLPTAKSPALPPALPVQHRRACERLDLEVEVDLVSDHNFYTGLSTNISEGGLFIATHTHKPVGATIEIRFTLPGDSEPISAVAEVRWARVHNEQSDTPPGLGMRFVHIADGDMARIHAFIEAMREPLFHEE